MTTRYKMTMAYDGHLFHGFQLQPDQRTVQGTIEDALKKMTRGQRVIVKGSGRTDAGVHAGGQVIHFDYPGKTIPANRMILALNFMMPTDIIFDDCKLVNENFIERYSFKMIWICYCSSL